MLSELEAKSYVLWLYLFACISLKHVCNKCHTHQNKRLYFLGNITNGCPIGPLNPEENTYFFQETDCNHHYCKVDSFIFFICDNGDYDHARCKEDYTSDLPYTPIGMNMTPFTISYHSHKQNFQYSTNNEKSSCIM